MVTSQRQDLIDQMERQIAQTEVHIAELQARAERAPVAEQARLQARIDQLSAHRQKARQRLDEFSGAQPHDDNSKDLQTRAERTVQGLVDAFDTSMSRPH